MALRFKSTRASVRLTAVVASIASIFGLALAGPAVADPPSTVSINDVTITEGNSGTTTAVFRISLTQASAPRTTIAYSTADSSARIPGDYASAAPQPVFASGTASKTVVVEVV